MVRDLLQILYACQRNGKGRSRRSLRPTLIHPLCSIASFCGSTFYVYIINPIFSTYCYWFICRICLEHFQGILLWMRMVEMLWGAYLQHMLDIIPLLGTVRYLFLEEVICFILIVVALFLRILLLQKSLKWQFELIAPHLAQLLLLLLFFFDR